MKKIFINAFISTIVFIGCTGTITTGNGTRKIVGNGKIKNETREISSFSAIVAEGVFTIVLKQSEKENIEISADENIIPVIITSVEHDTLSIRLKDSLSISQPNTITIYVTLKNISSIASQGVGNLRCADTLHLNSLSVDCEGVGTTSLLINTKKLIITSKLVGTLAFAGFSNETKIMHEGVGSISGFDLHSSKLSLNTNGVGISEVFASDELNIDASGIGEVKYKGGASKKEIKNNGIGKVICVDCK